MANIKLVMLILAFVLLLLASLRVGEQSPQLKVSLGWLGLALWLLSIIIT